MTVNGKEYKFKYPTFALVKEANAFVTGSKLLSDIQALVELDVKSDEWHAAVKEWQTFCELVIENADHGLDLGLISPHDLLEIPRSFFVLALAGQTEPKS
jgi:hypothetical protein